MLVSCHNLLEATAVVRCPKAMNVIVTHSLPFRFRVDRQLSNYELLRCSRKDPGDWKFDYEYNYTIGVPSPAKTVTKNKAKAAIINNQERKKKS